MTLHTQSIGIFDTLFFLLLCTLIYVLLFMFFFSCQILGIILQSLPQLLLCLKYQVPVRRRGPLPAMPGCCLKHWTRWKLPPQKRLTATWQSLEVFLNSMNPFSIRTGNYIFTCISSFPTWLLQFQYNTRHFSVFICFCNRLCNV